MSEYVFSWDKIKCCKYCPCNRYDSDKGSNICVLLDRVIEGREENTKAEDCLLTELPETHGRLIDADKLKSKIIRERDGKGLMSLQATKKYNFALDKIFDAPTVLGANE